MTAATPTAQIGSGKSAACPTTSKTSSSEIDVSANKKGGNSNDILRGVKLNLRLLHRNDSTEITNKANKVINNFIIVLTLVYIN